MINYLLADKNTLIWICFAAYTLTAFLIIPNPFKSNSQFSTLSVDASNEKALQFASRLVFRVALLFPFLIIIQNLV